MEEKSIQGPPSKNEIKQMPINWKGPQSDYVQQLFSSIAKKYDLTNQVLSLGIHHLWRQQLVTQVPFSSEMQLLDCATGTGDIIFSIWRYWKKHLDQSSSFQGQFVGIDFCESMLQIARNKNVAIQAKATFSSADILSLPFETGHFDVVTIAFGIRNVEDPQQAIKEMTRVLKPGGKLLILEFGQIKSRYLRRLYDWYSQKWLPLIGGLLTRNKLAYVYLENTSKKFPSGEDFLKILNDESHLTTAMAQALTGGIAYLYSAYKKTNV